MKENIPHCMNGPPQSTQLQAAVPITWTQHTFLVLLRRHLQTMMKAVEELQTISVGTRLAGRRQEAIQNLKHGETQETKQRQKVRPLPLLAASLLKERGTRLALFSQFRASCPCPPGTTWTSPPHPCLLSRPRC